MYGGEYGQGPGPGENVPAWLIFDQRYRNRYIFAGLQPRQRIPGLAEERRIVKADTLEELAAEIGVPAEALAATVERFNGFARTGVDEDFHRGESAYDNYYGDPTVKPNPSSARSTRARSTRPRSCPATSAPRAAWSPTSTDGCCATTARSSRACTPPAMSARR